MINLLNLDKEVILYYVPNQKFYQLKADYSDELSFLDKTKFSIGALNEQ